MTDDAWRYRLSEFADRLNEPIQSLKRLLQDLVAHGIEAVGAAGGSILIPDDDGKNLRFFASYGPGADALADRKVPIEGSIAGYVFCTDQMTALGDLEEERPANFYAEISKQIGIATRAYLCVPIVIGGHAGGVATYVNRPGSPPYRPFQPDEMERAHAFAVIEAIVLRHLVQTQQLVRIAHRDYALALAALDPDTPSVLGDVSGSDGSGDPWSQVLLELANLPERDQNFCAEMMALVGRWRKQEAP